MRPRILARRAVSAALVAAASLPAHAVVGTSRETPQGTVQLVSRWATASRGGDAGLGVRFALVPGWHVYWKNSGDAGYPPALAVAPAAGLGPAALRFPAPERFELPGGLVSFGYGGTMVYPVDAALAADAGGVVAVRARLDYLVCADECIPYTAALALDLPVGEPAADAGAAAEIDRWRARLPRPAASLVPPVATVARWLPGAGGGGTIELALAAPGLRASAPDLFFEPQDLLGLATPRFAATAEGPAFHVAARPLDRTRPLPREITLAWTATGFETARGPLALEGIAALAPAAPRRVSRAVWIALAVALAASLSLRFRRTRTVSGDRT
jgi:suppressor for copper-sensitivity B